MKTSLSISGDVREMLISQIMAMTERSRIIREWLEALSRTELSILWQELLDG